MKVLILGSGRIYEQNQYVSDVVRERFDRWFQYGKNKEDSGLTVVFLDSDRQVQPDFVKDITTNNWWVDILRIHGKFDYIVDTIGPGRHMIKNNQYCKNFKTGCLSLLENDGKFYGMNHIY